MNLGAAAKTYLNSALKAKKWDVSDCILPQPLLLSRGLQPAAAQRLRRMAFPALARQALRRRVRHERRSDPRDTRRDAPSSSLGGQNKILWFSLPGFLAEFSGRPELMRELVEAFWNGLFYGVEPEPVEGFEFGGAASVPFSVIGAGARRNGRARPCVAAVGGLRRGAFEIPCEGRRGRRLAARGTSRASARRCPR